MYCTWAKVWADERGGWWRLPATLALVLCGSVLGLILMVEVFPRPASAGIFVPANAANWQEVARLFVVSLPKALAVAGLLAGIQFVHRKPLTCLFTDGRRFQFALAWKSAGLWALLWFAGEVVKPDGWAHLVRRAGNFSFAWWLVLSLCFLAVSVISISLEELLFRGYLQPRVAAWVKRPWMAVLLIAVLFSILHLRASAPAYTAISFAAVVFGVAALRAGTLAPLLGMHVAHDALASLADPHTTNAGATWWDAGSFIIALFLWLGWIFLVTPAPPQATQPSPQLAPQRALTEP